MRTPPLFPPEASPSAANFSSFFFSAISSSFLFSCFPPSSFSLFFLASSFLFSISAFSAWVHIFSARSGRALRVVDRTTTSPVPFFTPPDARRNLLGDLDPDLPLGVDFLSGGFDLTVVVRSQKMSVPSARILNAVAMRSLASNPFASVHFMAMQSLTVVFEVSFPLPKPMCSRVTGVSFCCFESSSSLDISSPTVVIRPTTNSFRGCMRSVSRWN
mmetsp:Transcript_7392/g.14234  ORF Transcript_7392/g.14234 Transcript_7392/m.14234 type:complete len:216 (-) Transcript_7392:2646-3293(-)